jgi:hypothetical protein
MNYRKIESNKEENHKMSKKNHKTIKQLESDYKGFTLFSWVC